MKSRFLLSGLAVGAVAVAGLAAVSPGASAQPARDAGAGVHPVRVCAANPAPGRVTCLALAMADANGRIIKTVQPLVGFNAADVRKAYHLNGLKSNGRTVAIIDAYGYSGLEKDLAGFRKANNLPPCTKNNGCLKVLDQRGGHDYPPNDSGWDLEQALDVDMVSAACPDCKILVVQGDAPTFKDLGQAVNTAAKQRGVVAISNSYGGGNGSNRSYYNHKGIAITASTGDSGYTGGLYPASDTHVIAVGGTSVFKDSSRRGYHETVWSGAGSGCSTSNPAPAYQQGVRTTCGRLDATADLSGPADPSNGGLMVYFQGHFTQVGGTSESAPMIAAVYALSGRTDGYPGKYPYNNRLHLYDITTGSNGSCGAPLCTAGKGWDGPTGLGTPNGVKAF